MARRFSPRALAGWLCVAGATGLAIAAEDTPPPGKSTIVAAPFLKKVERFRRKVVFFAKDVDLPFLKVPEQGEQTRILFHSDGVGGPGERVSGSVVMSKDGELLFCSSTKIFRATKEGPAEVVARLAELTIAGADKRPERLHFDGLLAASATEDTLYVALSDTGPPDGRPHSYAENAYFLGRLDRAARHLVLAKVAVPFDFAIDPETAFFYVQRKGLIVRKTFEGREMSQWRLLLRTDAGDLVLPPDDCRLAPSRQSLLLERQTLSSKSSSAPGLPLRSFFFGPMPSTDPKWVGGLTLLDFRTGRETVLPITGRTPEWGSDEVIYFLQEARREGGILETSLYRFQIGQKEPVRLFFVSCKPVELMNHLLGVRPGLSADRSWLAWQLPVESPESGTILIDLTNDEYRILGGRWNGVQLFYR